MSESLKDIGDALTRKNINNGREETISTSPRIIIAMIPVMRIEIITSAIRNITIVVLEGPLVVIRIMATRPKYQ